MSKTFLLHISHLESRAARCIRDKGRQSIYTYVLLLQDQDISRLPLPGDRPESRPDQPDSPAGQWTEAEPGQAELGPGGGDVQDGLQEEVRLADSLHPAAAAGLHHVLHLLQGVQTLVPLRQGRLHLILLRNSLDQSI